MINNELMQNSFAEVMINYCKRNGAFLYNQSQSTILSRILEVVYKQEHAFWLYAVLLETILPANFYSQTFYPQTYLEFTNQIMNEVDTKYMELAGQSVQMFCLKSFYTLFTNLENVPNAKQGIQSSEIAYFFLDFLYLLGNPKESLTVCDIGSDNKLQVGSMVPTKDGRLEKVHIDRTS